MIELADVSSIKTDDRVRVTIISEQLNEHKIVNPASLGKVIEGEFVGVSDDFGGGDLQLVVFGESDDGQATYYGFHFWLVEKVEVI